MTSTIFAYSIYSYWRPTFDDVCLDKIKYALHGGVLDGMYTNEERGRLIDETREAAETYLSSGYEIMPLRRDNEYLWEYIFLNRNEYQRHQFDNWEAFNDTTYVSNIESKVKSNKRPVAIFYMEHDTVPSFMYNMLNQEFKKDGRGSRFTIFTYSEKIK